jgi:hypothetical protein
MMEGRIEVGAAPASVDDDAAVAHPLLLEIRWGERWC